MTGAATPAPPDPLSATEPRRSPLRRWFVPVAVVLALLSAFLTFVVLNGLAPISPTHEVVVTFLLINAGTVFLLLLIIAREVWKVVQARRRGRAAARLHVQIVSLFSVIAVIPAVLVSIVANVTLDRGLDRLFSGPTRAVIQNSLIVANAYLHEHAQLIRGDILGMANDISLARPLFDQDRGTFLSVLKASAASRNLPGAMILDKDSNLIEPANTGMKQAFTTPAPEFLKNVDDSEPQIAVFIEANYVAAVIRLRAFDDTFLYVARLLDPRVVAQLRQTQASVAEYADIEARRLGIQVAFVLMFTVIALTVLMSAVLIGLNFANWLVAPIRRLMGAANAVSAGDLHVQVPVIQSEGDLAHLGETFNTMTQELRTQRDELVSASDVIDSRRRFIEAVLSSASAGIIGVDGAGRVGILNRSAEKLIGHSESETLGHSLSEVVPELDEMMQNAREGSQRLVQGQITITRDSQERVLSVRISAEQTSQSRDSYIITLDDITELVSAQRTSAWADVARRIAHEIKNPLTPIQLSAERLAMKLDGKVDAAGQAVLTKSVRTIVEQVDAMKRLVNEFRDYARLPAAELAPVDLNALVADILHLYENDGGSGVRVRAELDPQCPLVLGDAQQLRQVVHNLVQNAQDATEAAQRSPAPAVVIRTRQSDTTGRVRLTVIDGGTGFSESLLKRAFEPYVTTKTKGTGLGLAVVRKIADEHGARVDIANRVEEGETVGAQVSLSLPLAPVAV